jgi:hypothetical protein
MGSLGLHADPDGWLNAGYSIRTLMDSLDSELYDADRLGGAGLSQSWTGPVAEAFTGHWSGVRSRAEDLITQGRRAAAAIIDFGGRLEDFVRRAAELESYWLNFGLQLGLDGMHFALPWGFEQLPPVHQVSFHQWLTESERDVTAMWADIEAAVEDVVTALESLIAAFEDYALLDVGALSWAALTIAGDLVHDAERNPFFLVHDALHAIKRPLAGAADAAERFAWLARADVPLADAADQPAAEELAANAEQVAATTGVLSNVAKVGTPVALVAANVTTVAVVGYAINHNGWRAGLEENAGLIATTVTADGTDAALNLVAPGFGETPLGMAIGGVVGVGVGFTVQAVVNHRKAVGHALTDVGHGVEDAAGWEVKHVEGLVKFA